MEQRNKGVVYLVDILVVNDHVRRPLALRNPTPIRGWKEALHPCHLWEGVSRGEVGLICVMEAGSEPGLV